MRATVLAVGVVTLLTGSVAAQTQSLSGKVQVGDTIFLTDRTGVQTGGRLLRLSSDQLTLLVDNRERVLPVGDIGRVEKRDPLWNGMLIGAVPGALIGMASAGTSCSPRCGRDIPLATLVTGAIGAGIGAVIDRGIHGYSIVDGPSLGPPNARRAAAPVASLDELWQRVRQGDRIDVATTGGQKIAGIFVQASQTSVAINVAGRRLEIPSREVRVVTRRGNRYRSGAVWGGAIGLAATSGCAGGCNPIVSVVWLGSAAAFWGTMIGAAIPKHPVVYEPGGTASSSQVTPVIGPGRVGLQFSASF
jgi:hypothetical protein